jgi:hypothetical protein
MDEEAEDKNYFMNNKKSRGMGFSSFLFKEFSLFWQEVDEDRRGSTLYYCVG